MTCSHWLPFYANMSFVCNYKWWYGIEGQLYHKMNLMAFMSYQNEELWWISKIVKFVQKQLKKFPFIWWNPLWWSIPFPIELVDFIRKCVMWFQVYCPKNTFIFHLTMNIWHAIQIRKILIDNCLMFAAHYIHKTGSCRPLITAINITNWRIIHLIRDFWSINK